MRLVPPRSSLDAHRRAVDRRAAPNSRSGTGLWKRLFPHRYGAQRADGRLAPTLPSAKAIPPPRPRFESSSPLGARRAARSPEPHAAFSRARAGPRWSGRRASIPYGSLPPYRVSRNLDIGRQGGCAAGSSKSPLAITEGRRHLATGNARLRFQFPEIPALIPPYSPALSTPGLSCSACIRVAIGRRTGSAVRLRAPARAEF